MKSKGFTLIEIVVVVAIAGLIMGLVFTSISGAQKARRDQARKSDINRFVAALEQSAGNNAGVYPVGCGCNPVSGYWTATPPLGGAYSILATKDTTPITDYIYYDRSAKCNGGQITALVGENQKYAVAVGLETGGGYCRDNQ